MTRVTVVNDKELARIMIRRLATRTPRLSV